MVSGSRPPVKGPMLKIEQSAPSAPRYRNQATQRVLSVLIAFSGKAAPMGVTEISKLLGVNMNMVHRALTTLVAADYLARDASGTLYQLSPKLLSLSRGTIAESDIVVLARPVLENLHRLTGESVYLSIIVGRNRVTVDDVQPEGARVLRSQRGHPVPLHCTKMSRVLLAHRTDDEIASYLRAAAPLLRPQRFPDPPSESEPGVWEDIHAIRRTPYVLWRNPHLSSAAYGIFPLRDAQGKGHAIVTIGGPRERFDIPRIKTLLPEIAGILEPLQNEARLIPAPLFVLEP
jgi:DNA-binding IclR family transcriptional regulator